MINLYCVESQEMLLKVLTKKCIELNEISGINNHSLQLCLVDFIGGKTSYNIVRNGCMLFTPYQLKLMIENE